MTNRAGPMEHADAEVPEQESAVFANAAYPVVAFIAPPRIEGNRADP